MTSLPIGCLSEKTADGYRQYVLIIPKERHSLKALVSHQFGTLILERIEDTELKNDSSQIEGEFSRDTYKHTSRLFIDAAKTLKECQRFQDSSRPYTVIAVDDRLEVIEGTIEPIDADDLEEQWLTELEISLNDKVPFTNLTMSC